MAIKLRTVLLIGSVCAAAGSGSAFADGWLWMGAEFAGKGSIYRYSIETGTIDLVVSPVLPPGGSHFNNLACDATTLYIGTPTTQYIGKIDPATGAFLGSSSYSPDAGGHKEDGAVHPGTGQLWRATFSNLIHETTTTGTILASYSGSGSLVGLEWVDETLYATDYTGGRIGRIQFDGGSSVTFVPIPWDPEAAPDGPFAAGLAYDQHDKTLYMSTYDSGQLWHVSFNGGLASAVLVANLYAVGLPKGALVDGMGWWATPQDCPPDLNGDGVVNGADLALVLGNWNSPGGAADINNDGIVNGADLALILGAWGPC